MSSIQKEKQTHKENTYYEKVKSNIKCKLLIQKIYKIT